MATLPYMTIRVDQVTLPTSGTGPTLECTACGLGIGAMNIPRLVCTGRSDINVAIYAVVHDTSDCVKVVTG